MSSLPKLKEEDLRAYFQEHLNDTVGRSMSANHCPITQFYKDKYNAEVSVTRDDITYYPLMETHQIVPMDSWASSFVRLLDRRWRNNIVTGKQSLHILNEATQKEKKYES